MKDLVGFALRSSSFFFSSSISDSPLPHLTCSVRAIVEGSPIDRSGLVKLKWLLSDVLVPFEIFFLKITNKHLLLPPLLQRQRLGCNVGAL